MIEDVLVFIKCYQCGGETLGPVVKHSVRDSKDPTLVPVVIGDFIHPGKPMANMYFVLYGYS